MNKTNFVIMLLISAVLGSTAIAFSLTREARPKSDDNRNTLAPVGSLSQTQDGQRRFPDDKRIHSRSLSGGLRGMLVMLGDRLEKPGKERTSYTGLLQRAGEDRPTPFALTWETPGRLRLEDIARQQVTLFDGEILSRSESPSTAFDDELLETLAFDSAEHLFVSQMQGAATRFLGSRFRLAEDSRAEYSGPFYDVFEVTETNAIRQGASNQTRQYFFNSDSQVLERVRYRVSKNGMETPVEVRLENWQRTNGQFYPSRIIRLENAAPVITLTISSMAVSPWVDDELFKSR